MTNTLSYAVVWVCGLAVGGKSIPPHTTENVTKPTPFICHALYRTTLSLELIARLGRPAERDWWLCCGILCVCLYACDRYFAFTEMKWYVKVSAKREESLLLLPPSSPPRPDKNGSLFQAHPLKVSMKLHVAKGVLFPPRHRFGVATQSVHEPAWYNLGFFFLL